MLQKYRAILYKPVLYITMMQMVGVTLYTGHTCFSIMPAPGRYVAMGLLAAFAIATVVGASRGHTWGRTLLSIFVVSFFWVGVIMIWHFIFGPSLGQYNALIWFGFACLLLLWGLSWWVLKSPGKVKRKKRRSPPVPRTGKQYRVMYTTVLWLTLMQMVAAVAFVGMAFNPKIPHPGYSDKMWSFITFGMVFYMLFIVAMVWEALGDRSTILRAGRTYLLVAMFFSIVPLFAESGNPLVVAVVLLLLIFWLFSFWLLGNPPAGNTERWTKYREKASQLRARLRRPVLYICLWQIIIINGIVMYSFIMKSYQPWSVLHVLMQIAVVLISVAVVVGFVRGFSVAAYIMRLYLISLVFGNAIAILPGLRFFELYRYPFLLLSLLLMLIWLFFLWVLQTPPQKIDAPAVEDQQEENAPTPQAMP